MYGSDRTRARCIVDTKMKRQGAVRANSDAYL